MPRFYVLSENGDADCLAYRLVQEGHDVVLNIRESWCRSNLQGLVRHTDLPPRQDDIVIFGTSKLGDEAATMQAEGLRVIGSAPIADKFELDRWAFMQLCEKLDIDIPETQRFTDFQKARDFLVDDGGRFVFKPCGEAECSETYVAHGAEDLLLMLEHFERTVKTPAFLLQRFCEGVEISLEGWWNGDEFVDGSWNSTFETKKFMPGDIGVATGCSTSTVWPYPDTPSWARNLHYKFSEVLRKGQYRGPFDLNCIVTRDAVYVLECTPRWGLDAVQLFVELWQEPFGDVLHRLAEGELDSIKVDTNLMTASMRLSVPPYPNSSKDHRAPGDIPVLIDDADLQRLWPSGIRYDREQDGYFTAPTDGVLGALVAHGTTLERAVTKLLACAKRIHVPNLQYRNDVGDGDGTAWQTLAKWGFPLPPVARRLVKDAPAAKHVEQMARGALGLGSPFGVQPFMPT